MQRVELPANQVPARRQLEDAIRAIADRLENNASGREPWLGDGKVGVALALLYAYRYTRDRKYKNAFERLLEQAIAQAQRLDQSVSLYSGMTGLGWLLMHAERCLGLNIAADACADLDSSLVEFLEGGAWDGNIDLIHGMTGIGVYALSHVSARSSAHLMGLVLQNLEKRARPRRDGITWESPWNMLSYDLRMRKSGDVAVLGMAHGSTALLCLLTSAIERDLLPARARQMVKGLYTWHCAEARYGAPEIGLFPYEEGGKENCRFAWCYGEAGIYPALTSVASRFGLVEDVAKWQAAALTAWGARSRQNFKILDAHLCHGWIGVAYCYAVLAEMCRSDELLARARWMLGTFEERIELFADEKGRFPYVDEPSTRRVYSPGFLSGEAGLLLGLIGLQDSSLRGWDEAIFPGIRYQTV